MAFSAMRKLSGLIFTPGANNTWQVAFRGMSTTATYYVAAVSALGTPEASDLTAVCHTAACRQSLRHRLASVIFRGGHTNRQTAKDYK